MSALVLAACGSGVEGGHDSFDVEGVTWPAEATAAVVAMDTGGGLPPPERVPARFAAVPEAVVYGDGTAVWQQEAGLRTARLDEDGVRTVLGWAGDADLLEPGGADTGHPEVFDVGTTRYDLTTDGGTVHTDVYAPGFENEGVGLSAAELATRARIEEFRQRLLDLGASLDAEHFMTPEGPLDVAWEVVTRPATVIDQLTGDEPVWTLDDPATVGRCRVVTGDDAAQVAEDVGATGEAQLWAVDGEPWVVVARPLLPGAAEPCPGPG